MKKNMIRMLSLAVCGLGGHTATWAADSPLEWKSDDGTASFKVGGVIRVQQRYESWKESQNRGFGKADFDVFRLDLKGTYDNFYLNSSFLLQDQ